MVTLKTAQAPQSSLAEKFTMGVLCLGLISFTILNNISALFPPFIPLVLIAVTIVLIQPYLSRRKGFSLRKVYFTAIGILTTVMFNVATHPADAQFMEKAKTFFTNSFKDSSGSATTISQLIALTFNVLRGIYVIYLAVSLMGIFNSMRNDEDWMTAARTPMIVLISVTIGDLLSGLITGT